ncbi:MAG TPA: formate/nitrite transporter family protein [Pyrinomonadaceae bacterium]
MAKAHGDEERTPAEQTEAGRPQLSPAEHKDAEERRAPRTEVIYEAILREGDHELQRSTPSLMWDGLTAGLSMGFSLVAEGLLRAHLPEAHWRPAVAKLGYSFGFLIVVLGRQQLFTENTLTVVLPLLQRRDVRTLTNMLRLWVVVLAANLVGAFVFAWFAGHTDLFAPEVREAFGAIGRESLAGGSLRTLLRGVYAGWLIATMVWMLPAAEAARFWVVLAMTYLVAFGGFAHVVAGSIDVFYLVTTGQMPWSVYFGWLLPTLAGNILGGVTLVAVLGHAQVE